MKIHLLNHIEKYQKIDQIQFGLQSAGIHIEKYHIKNIKRLIKYNLVYKALEYN